MSILIPVFNEQDNLQSIYDRLLAVVNDLHLEYELLFINDGSTDQSLSIIKNLQDQNEHVKFISFSRNFGHQIAISAGIDHCKGTQAVFIDADLQDPPELIGDLIDKMNEGYNVVYAQRGNRKGESYFKKSTAKLNSAYILNNNPNIFKLI